MSELSKLVACVYSPTDFESAVKYYFMLLSYAMTLYNVLTFFF